LTITRTDAAGSAAAWRGAAQAASAEARTHAAAADATTLILVGRIM